MSAQDLRNRVFKGTFWVLLEQLGSKASALVVEVVLARILLPEDYGLVALAAVFITIANTVAIDGLSLALVQKESADDVDFSTGFFLNLVVSSAIYLLIFFTAPSIASFYGLPALCDVLRALALSVPISSLNSIQRAYATRNMLFKRFFVSSTAAYVLSGSVSIVMAYRGMGVWALAAQTILASVFDTVILWFTVKWRPSLRFSFPHLKELWSFGWKILASNLLYQLCFQLRSVVVGKKYSASDLAFFNRGELIPALIACTADKAMQTALFPVMSKAQSNSSEVRNMLRRFVKTGCYVVFPAMALLAAVAEPLVEFVFTEKWLPCVPFVWAFCACYSLQSLQSGSLLALRAVGRSDTTLAQDCIKRVVDIALLLVSLQFGPIAIACSCFVSSLFSMLVNAAPCKSHFNYGIGAQLADAAPMFFMAIAAGGVSCLVLVLSLPTFARLLLQTFVFIAVYFSLSMLTSNDSYRFIKTIICSTIRRGE